MLTKRVKVQNQAKLFCGTRYQNSDVLQAWGINNQNTAQDSFWGFNNASFLSNDYTVLHSHCENSLN